MQQRTVILTVTDDAMTNKVAINSNDIRIGYAGEHMAVLLKFDLPESWVSDSNIRYQILFLTSDGQKYCTDILDIAEFSPPSAVMVEGKLYIQVVAVDPNGEIIKKTEICKCIVEPSIADGEIIANTDGVKLVDELTDELQAAIDAAEDAVTNLKNEIDTASGVLSEITDNYDAFASFPNQSVNIMKNHKNFTNTDGWYPADADDICAVYAMADGTLQVNVTNRESGVYGALARTIDIDDVNAVLIKIRAKSVLRLGLKYTIRPVWRNTINGTFLAPEHIVASNLDNFDSAKHQVSWDVGEEWRDLWLIAKNAPKSINQIGFFLDANSGVYISQFDVYYSADDLNPAIALGDYEIGTITDFSATYDSTAKMNGSYTLMGNLCFVTATADINGGWADIDYPLPVAAIENTATLSTDGTVSYRVSTDKNNSKLYIHRVEENETQNDGEISFTLIYKYR